MIDLLNGMVCFITAVISFLYGTRLAWMCGRKCQFQEPVEERVQRLKGCVPAAIGVYFFGFLAIFGVLMDGFLGIFIFSLTSALVVGSFVVSMAMPSFKRRPDDVDDNDDLADSNQAETRF